MAEKKLVIRMDADTARLQAGMVRASASTKSFGRSIEQGITKHAAGIRMTGMAIAGLGAALTAVTALAVKSAADFGAQLAQVSTMLDETSMELMPQYSDQLREMSKTFGESTKTLSDGLYDILSASIAPTKALEVLDVAARAAAAGITDTGTAADAITTVLNAYQLQAEEAASVSDWLFAVVKRGKTTFAELAPAIGKVATVANMAGVSMEELGAMVATLTRSGVATDRAMTAILGTLRAFLKASDESAETAEIFGVAMNTTTLRTEGLRGVMLKLVDAESEQLAQIFPNIRGLLGFSAALGDAEGYAEDLDLMLNRSGLTMAAFDKITATVSFAFGQLKMELGDVVRALGLELIPIIKKDFLPMVRDLIEKLMGLVTWFAKLPEPTKKFAMELGPVLIALGGMIALLPTATRMVAALGTTFGAATAAVGGGIGAIIFLWIKWDETWAKYASSVAGAILPIIKLIEGADGIIPVLKKLVAYNEFAGRLIVGTWMSIGTNIKNWATWIATNVPSFFKKLIPGVESVFTEIPEIVGIGMKEAREILETELAEIDASVEKTGEGIKLLGETIEQELARRWSDFGKDKEGLDLLKAISPALVEVEDKTANYIVAIEDMGIATTKTYIGVSAMEGLLKTMPGSLEKTKDRTADYITAIEDMGIASIKTFSGISMIEGVLKSMPGVLEKVKNKTDDFITAIKNMGVASIETFSGISMIEGLIKSMPGPLEKVGTAARNFITNIEGMGIASIETFSGISMIEGVLKSMPGVLEKAGTATRNFITAIEDMGIASIKTFSGISMIEGLLRSMPGPLVKVKKEADDFISAIRNLGAATSETYSGLRMTDGLLRAMPGPLVKVRKETDNFIAAIKKTAPISKEAWKETIKATEKAADEMKEIWDSFTSDVKSSWSSFFESLIAGTATFEDAWQTLVDSIKTSFIKALADSLVEKMGWDKIFEGNILNLGNLFTGLGNLITNTFSSIGAVVKGIGGTIASLGSKIVGVLGPGGTAMVAIALLPTAIENVLVPVMEGIGNVMSGVREGISNILGLEQVNFDRLDQLTEKIDGLAEGVGTVTDKNAEKWQEHFDFLIEKGQEWSLDTIETADMTAMTWGEKFEYVRQFAKKAMESMTKDERERYEKQLEHLDKYEHKYNSTYNELLETARKVANSQFSLTDATTQQQIEAFSQIIAANDNLTEIQKANIYEVLGLTEEAAREMAQAMGDSADDMADSMDQATRRMTDDMDRVPRRIDFGIFGELHMPDIPDVPDKWYSIRGKYEAPSPSPWTAAEEKVGGGYQHGGQIEPGELVFSKPITDWIRAALSGGNRPMEYTPSAGMPGAGVPTRNIIVNVPRGAFVVYGDIRTKADVEELTTKTADRMAESIAERVAEAD